MNAQNAAILISRSDFILSGIRNATDLNLICSKTVRACRSMNVHTSTGSHLCIL